MTSSWRRLIVVLLAWPTPRRTLPSLRTASRGGSTSPCPSTLPSKSPRSPRPWKRLWRASEDVQETVRNRRTASGRSDNPTVIMTRVGHEDWSTMKKYLRQAEVLQQGFGDVFGELPAALLGNAPEAAKIALKTSQ